jgi:hypothetical protein
MTSLVTAAGKEGVFTATPAVPFKTAIVLVAAEEYARADLETTPLTAVEGNPAATALTRDSIVVAERFLAMVIRFVAVPSLIVATY